VQRHQRLRLERDATTLETTCFNQCFQNERVSRCYLAWARRIELRNRSAKVVRDSCDASDSERRIRNLRIVPQKRNLARARRASASGTELALGLRALLERIALNIAPHREPMHARYVRIKLYIISCNVISRNVISRRLNDGYF